MSVDPQEVFDALVSHAQSIGHLEQVNQHEPKSAPQGLLTGAIWDQDTRAVGGGSGLNAVTAVEVFTVRIFKNMLSEPQDAIDPEVMRAKWALMGAYMGDFDLGGLIRNVDVFGEFGEGLRARAGYVPQDGRLYRVMDINVPCVINDMWSLSS